MFSNANSIETYQKLATKFCFRSGQRDLQPPDLPANLFFGLAPAEPPQSPALFSPLLEKLHSQLAPYTPLG